VSAFSNPATLDDADRQHERVLDLAPYHLDLTALNCESLEVVFSFDFVYPGNHDEVIAEALAANSPFDPLLQHPGAKVLHFEPSMVVALDEKCRLQARLWVESRTNTFQVQSGQFPEAPISVYFMVNQMWGKGAPNSFVESYQHQRKLAQEFVDKTFSFPSVHYCALLLRLSFLESQKRKDWFEANPPARIHVSSRRLPMMHRDGWDGNKSTSTLAHAWFIWLRGYDGAPQLRWFDWRDFASPEAAE